MEHNVVLLAGEKVILDVSEIVPYPQNNKTHSEEAITKLIRSIEKGYDQPITVDRDNVIVKGHCRHLALQQMGVDRVECIRRADLTEEECRIARILDNTVVEDDWSIDTMMKELRDLNTQGAIGSLIEVGLDNDKALEILGPENLEELMTEMSDQLESELSNLETLSDQLDAESDLSTQVMESEKSAGQDPLTEAEPFKEIVYPSVDDEEGDGEELVLNVDRTMNKDHTTIKPMTLNVTVAQRTEILRKVREAENILGGEGLVSTIEKALEFVIDHADED